MMIVVADTSPINYLLLIGQIDVLARIYQGVIVPRAVFDELTSAGAPIIVRDWLSKKPAWLSVSDSIIARDQSLDYLDEVSATRLPLLNSFRQIVSS